jgi:hypothetical protein
MSNLLKDVNMLNNKVTGLETKNVKLQSEVDELKSAITEIQTQSTILQKMHLIADLFKPMFTKFNSKMKQTDIGSKIEPQRFPDYLKKYYLRGHRNEEDEQLVTVVETFEEVAAEYGMNSTLAAEYVVQKMTRNEAVHYNRRIKEYAKSTTPQRDFARFLSKYPDLETEFLPSEVQSLNTLFCRVCEEQLVEHHVAQ